MMLVRIRRRDGQTQSADMAAPPFAPRRVACTAYLEVAGTWGITFARWRRFAWTRPWRAR